MNITFPGQNVLVTGAAGHLGREICRAYRQSGAESILLLDQPDRREELELLAAELGNSYLFFADLTSVQEIEEAAGAIRQSKIPVDILVNNAGVNVLQKPSEVTEEMWDYVVDLNLKGAFFLTRRITNDSLMERKGNIVFISSQHGVVGNTQRAAYCSSKSGLLGLVRALTADWAPFGIRVNAVSPTYILNDANRDQLLSAAYKRSCLQHIPLKRYPEPADIAQAVLFLTSSCAAMITGHNLVVDGGYTAI